MPPKMPNPFEYKVSNVKTESVESAIETLPLEIRDILKVITEPGEEHVAFLSNQLIQNDITNIDLLINKWKTDGVIVEKLNALQTLIEVFFEKDKFKVSANDANTIVDFLNEEFENL